MDSNSLSESASPKRIGAAHYGAYFRYKPTIRTESLSGSADSVFLGPCKEKTGAVGKGIHLFLTGFTTPDVNVLAFRRQLGKGLIRASWFPGASV
jgi:hypothetical protein